MNLTDNEIRTLIERLRALNVATWELVALVPPKGNTSLINVIEAVVNETDALVARLDQAEAEDE